ncbi:MAG TPA: septum formation initiator family protein [Kiritimatiellia bacterium]|nr:septum formation initiator family protein [Kiritimatiellia bacterium]
MNIWTLIIRLSWAALFILIFIALAGVFYPKFQEHRELQNREAQLREEVRIEEEMLQNLRARQEKLRSDPRFVERIAREELGLAKPGETVFKFMDDPPTNGRPRRP